MDRPGRAEHRNSEPPCHRQKWGAPAMFSRVRAGGVRVWGRHGDGGVCRLPSFVPRASTASAALATVPGVNTLRRALFVAAQYWQGTRPERTPLRVSYTGGPAESPVTTWSFDRDRYGDEVRIAFTAPAQMRRLGGRCRDLARAIHLSGREDPAFRFDQVRIHVGDGVHREEPQDVLAFARRPGSRAGLIPNPYLLWPRPGLPAPLPWEAKTDTLYFRGASTGTLDYDTNARVLLCRTARSIPRSDCRVSKLRQIDRGFSRRLVAEGLVARPDPISRLNRHRLLVDVDGNTSSWDRYLVIGLVGGVPIRFEPAWEECWHDALVDRETCRVADRHTLPAVVQELRTHQADARLVADHAGRVARTVLEPAALRRRLRETLAAASRPVVGRVPAIDNASSGTAESR